MNHDGPSEVRRGSIQYGYIDRNESNAGKTIWIQYDFLSRKYEYRSYNVQRYVVVPRAELEWGEVRMSV